VKVTVGSGDRGRTSLLSGERVTKDDARVEACGAVDELNSTLGALAAALSPDLAELRGELQGIQAELMRVGARLSATPASAAARMLDDVPAERTRDIEQAMDRLEKGVPPLQGFLLPGGHPSSAWAHIARTVCRRAERRALVLVRDAGEAAAYYAGSLSFLNRLSDYLFVLARFCNFRHGVPDIAWRK
jgi:cob(I)alamin adenosyltransferase